MKKTTPSAPPPGVVHISEIPREALPPDGWKANGKLWNLKCGPAKGDRLARLEDVAIYLMEKHEMPPAEATAWLCDSLEAADPELFLANASDFAEAMPTGHRFDCPPRIWGDEPAPAAVADCGLAGAAKHMREFWNAPVPSKAGFYGQRVLDPLAVRLAVAFELWGYGRMTPAHQAQGAIDPVAGWQQSPPIGFMGFDSTPTGRLVRLADVVRWLESTRALPRSNAVDALCTDLHAGVSGALYCVQPREFAEPIPANCPYGFKTVQDIKDSQAEGVAKIKRSASDAAWGHSNEKPISFSALAGGGGGRFSPTVKPQAPVAPGMPALLRRIRQTWGVAPRSKTASDPLDDPRSGLATVAIRVDTAFELWGWGADSAASVVPLTVAPAPVADPRTWTDLLVFRKEHEDAEWTVQQKNIVKTEAARRKEVPGATSVAQSMAKALGISKTRINELIRTASELGNRATARKKSA